MFGSELARRANAYDVRALFSRRRNGDVSLPSKPTGRRDYIARRERKFNIRRRASKSGGFMDPEIPTYYNSITFGFKRLPEVLILFRKARTGWGVCLVVGRKYN